MTNGQKAAITRAKNKEFRDRLSRISIWIKNEMPILLMDIVESPDSTIDQKLKALELLQENRKVEKTGGF